MSIVVPTKEQIAAERDAGDIARLMAGGADEGRASQHHRRAMRLALLYPKPEKGGRGKKGKVAETAEFSRRRLQEARTVLAHSRELALAVRVEPKNLTAAPILPAWPSREMIGDTTKKRAPFR